MGDPEASDQREGCGAAVHAPASDEREGAHALSGGDRRRGTRARLEALPIPYGRSGPRLDRHWPRCGLAERGRCFGCWVSACLFSLLRTESSYTDVAVKPIWTVFGIMNGSGMKLCLGYRDDIYIAVVFVCTCICKCRLSCLFFRCVVKKALWNKFCTLKLESQNSNSR